MIFFIPFLSALSYLVIEVMVILNPSATNPLGAISIFDYIFFVLPVLTVFFMQYAAVKQNEKKKFFVLFIIQLIAMAIYIILFGSFYHRDFYTYVAQIILLNFVLVLLKLDDITVVRNRKSVYLFLSVGSLTLFILWMIWIMMMAYAIVIRKEPRWIESIGYNSVNLFIGFFMLFSVVIMWHRVRKRLYFKDQNLYIEDINIFEVLSVQESQILKAFLFNKRTSITCMELNVSSGDSKAEDLCFNCIKKDWTSTSCTYYKNYKNKIARIKKYLELLQIGTIVSVSDNPRKIKESGWRLRFFDDISYQPPRQ